MFSFNILCYDRETSSIILCCIVLLWLRRATFLQRRSKIQLKDPNLKKFLRFVFMHHFSYLQSILGEFNREQDAFIKGQERGGGAATAPWLGAPNEAALKEECLSLSTVSSFSGDIWKTRIKLRLLLSFYILYGFIIVNGNAFRPIKNWTLNLNVVDWGVNNLCEF